MFTYGYIREATMAHIDMDEQEAQAMNLLNRFHIFANEAMQAICGSKPKYQYIEAKVIAKLPPLVMDGGIPREATKEELLWNDESHFDKPIFLNDTQTKKYYSDQGIYAVGDKLSMTDDFIAFANKQAWKYIEVKPTTEELLNWDEDAIARPTKIERLRAKIDYDFSYVGKNAIKFYKTGTYLIPAKYLWFRFISGIGDDTDIDMPSDVFLTIPLYVASICLQIDNPQKANIKRSEFELALGRCTNSDFMELNEVKASW